MAAALVPFTIAIDQSDLEDLRVRLSRTRWPERETVSDWSQGVPLAYVQSLCEYWRTSYDWRSTESRLNAISQYVTEIDGLDIHFFHAPSPHPGALPLVLTSGWPGSIVEFLKVIGPLTDPPRYGGRAEDAFHVVCPTLPGYGFSGKPERPGWNVQRIARAWTVLMQRLGYERYGAQGHDWGNSITTSVGQQDLARVVGIHVIPPIVPPDPATLNNLTRSEREALVDLQRSAETESGYAAEQSTKPQTVGYGLVDSPVALCAWVVEKFWSWSDHDGDLEPIISRDELLDNVMLYWLTRSGASSARLYWESFAQVSDWFRDTVGDPVSTPTGCSVFPHDVPRPSRRWAAQRYTNIVYWSELDGGGHFAALERPDVFVDELRRFFQLVR
jgi:epoxide hydrolase